ncbi:paraneoplastic antigen Ma6E-like [Cydia amplana]|uniref:paraneoplastic antigen Ma6E-like n=1 Tax=Cydia amplana TaxID=1869771 RepID=UPI002FE61AA3
MSPFAVLVLCAQACLIQAVFSQQFGCNQISYGSPDLIELGGNEKISLSGPISYSAPSVSLSAPGYASASYGGAGTGQVGVSGDIGASGQTVVVGSVPVLGSVEFSGKVPASGSVSISGQCGCGCKASIVARAGTAAGATDLLGDGDAVPASVRHRRRTAGVELALERHCAQVRQRAGQVQVAGQAETVLSQQLCGCNQYSYGSSGLSSQSCGSYGGTGTGQVGVSGNIDACGNTCVVGSVPVLGSVDFGGCVPACGSVSIQGQCGCGCN